MFGRSVVGMLNYKVHGLLYLQSKLVDSVYEKKGKVVPVLN
jgi:hypothetical protein